MLNTLKVNNEENEKLLKQISILNEKINQMNKKNIENNNKKNRIKNK